MLMNLYWAQDEQGLVKEKTTRFLGVASDWKFFKVTMGQNHP